MNLPQLLRPDWPALPGVIAGMSSRAGGVSVGPFASLNLGGAVGDDAAAVAENCARFAAALGARPVWLQQVHGSRVVRLHGGAADAALPPADAALSSHPGVACGVLVADCLPVLMALRDGSAVAAAHAGWRGLAAGVLEATVQALCAGTGAAPRDIVAWLGPCIGPDCFEVGADVLSAFGVDPSAPEDVPGRGRAAARFRAVNQGKWLADLPALARDRLTSAEVGSISGGSWCTVSDPSRFFSYRRDGVTGRMVAAIWLTG